MHYWEEIESGQIYTTGTVTIDGADIVEFAREFDPQPYHLDPEIAAQSIFGGHCASGWQVCALMMRLLADTLTEQSIPAVGSPGVSSLRWLKPVFAGDTLNATINVTDCRESDNHPDYGLIDCAISVSNQHGENVIVLETDIMIARRQTSPQGS